MSTNYNLHGRPAEIIIDEPLDKEANLKYFLSKKQESLDDILKNFNFYC